MGDLLVIAYSLAMDALPVIDYVLVLDYLLLKYELPNILLVLDEPNKEESLLEDDLPKIKKNKQKNNYEIFNFFFS